jgi:hypothetical protein
MQIHRRTFFFLTASPLFSAAVRGKLSYAKLGEVFFCRVSESSLIRVARSIYPQCVASHEPRPGFRGITFCGSRSTVTLTTDRVA